MIIKVEMNENNTLFISCIRSAFLDQTLNMLQPVMYKNSTCEVVHDQKGLKKIIMEQIICKW